MAPRGLGPSTFLLFVLLASGCASSVSAVPADRAPSQVAAAAPRAGRDAAALLSSIVPATVCYPVRSCIQLKLPALPVTLGARVLSASLGSKRESIPWATYASAVDTTFYPNDEEYNLNPPDTHFENSAPDYTANGLQTVGYLDTNKCSGASIVDANGSGGNAWGATPDCSSLPRNASSFVTYRTSNVPVMVHDGSTAQLLGDPSSPALLALAESEFASKYSSGYDRIQMDDVASPAERLAESDVECGGIGVLSSSGFACGSAPQVASVSDLSGFGGNYQSAETTFLSSLEAAFVPYSAGSPGLVLNGLNVYVPGASATYTNMATNLFLSNAAVSGAICEECFTSNDPDHNLQILNDAAQATKVTGKNVYDIEHETDGPTRMSALAKLMLVYAPGTTYEAFDGCIGTNGVGLNQVRACPELAFQFFPQGAYQGPLGAASGSNHGVYFRVGLCYASGNLLGECVALANFDYVTNSLTVPFTGVSTVAIDDASDYLTCAAAKTCVATSAVQNGSVTLFGGQGTILLLGPSGNIDGTVLAGKVPV